MTKVDIYSGFLGAGKTTLIKKMLREFYAGQKIVLIENEFGEIGIDGGFLQEAGVEIREMNSGCICCSLVGDFGKAMEQVLSDYAPDRIIIEPSGVGKLSDVVAAVEKVEGVEIAYKVTVADATKVKSYMRNFGEFYNNQIASANAIILSRTSGIAPEKLKLAADMIREVNTTCTVITTPWEELTGRQLADAMEGADTIAAFMKKLQDDHHAHHHHDHEDGCCCGHDHHHHHADEAFTAWGVETAKKFTEEALHSILRAFDAGECGVVLRAKGIVPGTEGAWLHFDYVPEEYNVRVGSADVTGKLCVIGAKIDEEKIKTLFGV